MRGATAGLIAALALWAGGGLCGCGQERLRVLCLTGTPSEQLMQDRMAREYRRSGTAVEFHSVTTRDELIIEARKRPAADAIWASDAAIAELDKVIGLEDLAPRLRAAPERGGFAAAALGLCSVGERVRALPLNMTVSTLYVNVNLCQAAGVEVPAGGWTWSQYLAAARKATRDTSGDGVPEVYGLYRLSELEVLLAQQGVSPYDQGLTRARIVEDTRFAAALTFYLDLSRTYGAAWPSTGYDAVQVFGTGRAAMFVGSSAWVAQLRGMTDFEWDVRPAPADTPDSGAMPMRALCVALPQGAAKADEAWRFALFCASREGQEAGGDALLGMVPAYTPAAALAVFNPPRPTSYAALVQAAYRSKPSASNWARAYLERTAWGEELKRMLAGEQSVEQTVAGLQRAAEAVLKTNLAEAAEKAIRERR